MRRLPWVLLALGASYIAGHIAAHIMGQSPDVFFGTTLPRAIGYGIAVVLFTAGCAVTIAGVYRR